MHGGRHPVSSTSRPTSSCTRICGRNAAGVQAARAQLGWQNAATDWQEIVESPLIDIVDIVTPTNLHAEMAIAAAKNGKHVLCEKPLALNLKQAEAMFAAAQQGQGRPHGLPQLPAHSGHRAGEADDWRRRAGPDFSFSRALRAGLAGRPGISAGLAAAKGDQRLRRPQRHQFARH